MADIAELGLKVNATTVDQAGVKLKNFGKIASDTERKVIQSTNGLTRGLSSVGSAAAFASPKITGVSKTAESATKASGGFANSMRQVSLQLSQVAQQGSVTGNYFQALAIQLPDLLLGFGTFAILIGAVAGSLAGPLVAALSGSSKAIDDVIKKAREGEIALEDLGKAERELFKEQQKKQIRETTEELESYKKELEAAKSQTSLLLDVDERRARIAKAGYAGVFEVQEASTKEVQKNKQQVVELEAAIEGLNRKLKEEEAVLKSINLSVDPARGAESALSIQDSVLSELEAVTSTIQREGSTQSEIAIRAASERNSILAAGYNQDLISFAEYQELRVQNQLNLQAELTEIDKKAQEQRNQILTAGQQAALSASGQLFGNLASIAKEGGEDQFQEYKNLASAQAAIAASLAAIKALAEGGPIAGPALAVSIGAVAAIQIAKIQGQEYQSSRASGGQAKGRVLVGENGPEILNMGNSTGSITSAASTKQELGGQTVQQVFNISPGLSGAIQAEMRAMLPLIKQVAISGVSSDIRNGGSTAKAVGIR